MKLIGVLGGTSWPSTMLPYRLLNEEVERRCGAHHSARIALYSIDYHAIRTAYSHDWSVIPGLLRREIETLLAFGPDCWMIANNTLHKIYDTIAPDFTHAPPMAHAIRLVRDDLVARGARRVLLLGTRFTMEDGYYADPLRAAGLEVEVPVEADRATIGAIQTRLANGENDPAFTAWFATLIADHAARGCEAVILGCTELPLAIRAASSALPLVDPLVLQCRACVDLALAG
ncbi:aspartate/glutamate racemase family protein [Novosphingobium huizhouense]|uniref:aspartate/glutamate racemase family protein n=1 Tax=Novosphingobium huizhouense TaxID=2866625 RepID=UPI001CD82332|nr:amino acid racemase [Novosphingobium huizhouense]